MMFWREKTETLVIMFRSGASIRLDRITNWEVETDGEQIVGLNLTWLKSAKSRLIVRSLSFQEVVAITVEKGA